MKLVRATAPAKNKGVISVDQKTFAQLIDDSGDVLTIKVFYEISIEAAGSSIKDYDRVVITAKTPETEASLGIPDTSFFSTDVTKSAGYRTNGLPAGTQLVPTTNDTLVARSTYPSALAEKVFAGRILLESLKNSGNKYISSKVSELGSRLTAQFDSTFSTHELVRLPTKKNAVSRYSHNSFHFDPKNVIQNINKHQLYITAPALEKCTSDVNIDDVPTIADRTAGEFFYRSLLKYYLLGVNPSPTDESQVHYAAVQTVKKLNTQRFEETLQITKLNKNVNLTVEFEIYKKNSVTPDETVSAQLNLARLYSAYKTIIRSPVINATVSKGVCHVSVKSIDKNVSGYNFYVKEILSTGDVSDYRSVGKKSGKEHVEHKFKFDQGLAILRAVPYNAEGTESNVHSSIVIGGHDTIGNITICPSYTINDGKVRVEIFNMPMNTDKLFMYRRNCTNDASSKFELILESAIPRKINNLTVQDPKDVVPGSIFEYLVIVTTVEEDGSKNKKLSSNSAMIRHPQTAIGKKSITVEIKNFSSNFLTDGSFSISFDITSNISREEKSIITESLKQQLGELYELYLNPANNAASPLGDLKFDKYADLLVHEVVRTNLNTGDRETFALTADGTFTDGSQMQKICNVKPLDPAHNYLYQVFSFKKNPLLLFRNYVASGIDSKGNEWFYLPFKWLNTKVLTTGVLYPDDENGYPIVDGYENMTSEPIGLTATKTYLGISEIFSVNDVVVERLDIDTVQVRWSVVQPTTELKEMKLYDSFIVMKVVNGVRSFVGSTLDSYIYHELTNTDVGSIYYIVVPITKDMKIGNPGYSSDILIDPKGLINDLIVADGTKGTV